MKNHTVTIERDLVRQGHVTLTYKVTRDSCCVELYILTSLTLTTCKTKKKIIVLASLEQEIRKVTFRVTRP